MTGYESSLPKFVRTQDWQIAFAARLELVGFLGVGETGEGLRGAALVHFNFDGALGFGAGFAEQGEGGDGFVVNLSNQIRFAGIVFLPDLADLDLSDRHNTNVDRFEEGVNNGAKARFAGRTSSVGPRDACYAAEDAGLKAPATAGRPALHLNLRHDPNGKSGLGVNVNFSRAGN